jgi:hypothetical protein
MSPKTCDYEHVIREHIGASLESSSSTPARQREIDALVTIAKRSRSLSLSERELQIKDFCKTMTQLDRESVPRNAEMYSGMTASCKAVWADRNLGLFETCLKTWGWESEPHFSKYLTTGWDPMEIPETGFLEPLAEGNPKLSPTARIEDLKLDPKVTKEPIPPPFITEPAAAEDCWAAWESKV